MANPNPLPHTSRGEGDPPIVLIHGFGADRLTFAHIVKPLAKLRRTIAFDLPGHGEAATWEGTPDAVACAKAVAASLSALGVSRATLVGHSLGGAVSSIVALKNPALVEHLVLLAPGGFGSAMNVPLLRRYAAIEDEAEAARVLKEFFGPESAMPEALPRVVAEARRDPVLRDKQKAIVGAITKGEGQGALPLEDLASAGFPITLVWGTADAVLPFEQAVEAPALIARHFLKGVGHMPHLEAPDAVSEIVRRTLAGARTGA